MRIAYLTQPYPPMVSGAAIVAEQLARAMASRGHEVLVIAASENGSRYTVRQDNLTVLRLTSIHNPLRVGQQVMLFPRRFVSQALREFQPDLIHVHEPVHMGSLGLKYAKRAGIPITMTTHQLPWFVASYLPNNAALRAAVEKLIWVYAGRLLKSFTTIISPTATISNIIQSKTDLKPTTLNFGVDLKTFNMMSCPEEASALRAKLDIPAGAAMILHVGRLDVDKSVDRVLLAAASVMKRSGAHLLLAGDGCQEAELILLSRSLAIESQVHFLGFISHKNELAKIYKAADIFVTASEIETQGIVLLEAAACGLPIAAVNATCVSEVVQDGINGYLAGLGNIPELSAAVEKALNDPGSARSMQINSRLIAEKFDIDSCFSMHENLYQRMVEQRAAERRFTVFRNLRKVVKLWATLSGQN